MMSKIQVLDCTLRDGGYCNNFRFGFDNEKKIVHGLVEANINIIECGFLMNTMEYDKDVTKFTSLEEVAKIIPKNKEGKIFVMLLIHLARLLSLLLQIDILLFYLLLLSFDILLLLFSFYLICVA